MKNWQAVCNHASRISINKKTKVLYLEIEDVEILWLLAIQVFLDLSMTLDLTLKWMGNTVVYFFIYILVELDFFLVFNSRITLTFKKPRYCHNIVEWRYYQKLPNSKLIGGKPEFSLIRK